MPAQTHNLQLLHADQELQTWWDSAFPHVELKVEFMGITRHAGPLSQSARALTLLLNPCGIEVAPQRPLGTEQLSQKVNLSVIRQRKNLVPC